MDFINTPQVGEEYKVNLDIFEGPLDLLLYLIKKNDIDIRDIPMAFIAEEYSKYIETMKELNIDLASEYLVMAAELIYIKSKMLLPSTKDDQAEEEVDPRADLVNKLLEYQKYKEASLELSKRPLLFRDEFTHRVAENIVQREEIIAKENSYRLLEAFSLLIKKASKEVAREIKVDRISVGERIFQIIDIIKKGHTISIDALLPQNYSRYDLVITFLALLEMVKLSIIKVSQPGKYASIYITGIADTLDDKERLSEIRRELGKVEEING